MLKPLRWLLEQGGVKRHIKESWADLGRVRKRPCSLAEKIEGALEYYPCDLLFVHRDAERGPAQHRHDEIRSAWPNVAGPPVIGVVPVRMMEAWLLFDEPALRRAAGNPNGRATLSMPKIRELERLPDPKTTLYNIMREASELPSRRLQKSAVEFHPERIVAYLDDFTPLMMLTAFARLKSDIDVIVKGRGWHLPP